MVFSAVKFTGSDVIYMWHFCCKKTKEIWVEMTVVIYHKSISSLLANGVTSWVYKKRRCDFRSPLMKTLDWSVETLGRECNSTGLCIHFYKTRVVSETWLILYLVAVMNVQTLFDITSVNLPPKKLWMNKLFFEKIYCILWIIRYSILLHRVL